MKKILLFTTLFMIISQASEARIVNRRVKDAPKVCAVMKEDRFLSKAKKQVFGTQKHSVVIERNVSLLNDLGKKACQWNFDKLNAYGEIADFNFYIDEYKNYIYPYVKNEDKGYTMLKISLASCEIEDTLVHDKLQLPKCGKPAPIRKNKISKKRRVART